MKQYRKLQLIIFFVLTSYFMIANISRLMGSGEIFPVFSWDLYSMVVPVDTYDYGLRVITVDNTSFNPPVYIDAIEHLIPPGERTFDVSKPALSRYRQVQRLGHAVAINNKKEVALQRSQLESVHLAGVNYIEYEIVQRKINVISYLQTDEVDEELVIAVFERGASDNP